MKKFIKAGIMVVMAAALLAVGIFALANPTFNTTSTVSFSAVSAFVDIEGKVYVGTNQSGNTYEGKTYGNVTTGKPDDNAPAWAMGTLVLTDDNDTIKVVMKFTNKGDRAISIAITPPSAPTGTTLTGGLGTEGDQTTLVNATTDNVAENADVTFTYILTLNDYSQDITATAYNFSVQMTVVS